MHKAAHGPIGLVLGMVAVAVILFPSAAQAQYLDPGAGSMIVQVIIALVVGLAATAKIYWRRMTAILVRRSKERSGT